MSEDPVAPWGDPEGTRDFKPTVRSLKHTLSNTMYRYLVPVPIFSKNLIKDFTFFWVHFCVQNFDFEKNGDAYGWYTINMNYKLY